MKKVLLCLLVLSLIIGVSSIGLAGDGKWEYKIKKDYQKGEKLEQALAAKYRFILSAE
jgi:hypothetical protein